MRVLMSKSSMDRYVVAAFRANTARLMDERGMRQVDLARESGINKGSVADVLGRTAKGMASGRGPSIATAAAVAMTLGVTLDELCGLDRVRQRMAG